MIRWGYAINQFTPQFDDFVRRRQHERAVGDALAAGHGNNGVRQAGQGGDRQFGGVVHVVRARLRLAANRVSTSPTA